jgi:cytochrome c
MKRTRLFCTIIILVITLWPMTAFVFKGRNAANTPPKVFIANPVAESKFAWDEVVRYNIKINDAEDGNSEFEEINANEVLMEVSYFNSISKAKAYIAEKAKTDSEPLGLTLLKGSDCFSCHVSKGKLIGPSFELIAKKYTANKATIEKLTNNVINGSTGVWGTLPMPPHPGLKPTAVNEIVNWILTKNNNPDITYYTGVEGAFRTRQKPLNQSGNTVIVLTGSYLDHGEKDTKQNRKYGQNSLLLQAAE